MYVQKGGDVYSFCPGKATWDYMAVSYYHELIIMAELRCLPMPGGLYNQDSDIIDNLAWFLPKYDMMKFMRKAEMILGGDDKAKGALPKAPTRR